jgi:hypothetical protein
MQEAAGENWGFDMPADDDDLASYDAARGQSPKALADNYLGEVLDSGYRHDDVGATGDGEAGQNEGVDGDFEFFDPRDQPTPPAKEPSPIPDPPEEPPSVVAAPKKKKKGKKVKGPAADFLAPEMPVVDADAEERAAMEEKRLAEEDKLVEELRQLEVEEAELAELEEFERTRLIAEAEETERLELERRQDEIERQRLDDLRAKQEEIAAAEAAREFDAMAEERRRIMLAREREEEEESDLRIYRTLQRETVRAQEMLAMVEGELKAVEARRAEMLQQLESARLKEVAYQKRLRTK